jgi:hypothetical protein
VAEARAAASAEDSGKIFVPLLIAVLLVPAALGSSTTIFNDGDVSWHIATGLWILDHRAIPHIDPFSFTWAGKPWVPIEWLAEVIYAAAYRLDGYAGVAAVVTTALVGLHAIVFSNSIRWVRPWVAVGALVAVDIVLIPMMLARPHLLAWPLIALWTWLMLRAREQGSAPPLAAALVMVVWANLHGSFVMGLFIAGAFGVEAVVAAKEKMVAARQWLMFGAASVAAVFVNANGIQGVIHPLRIANLKMLPLIDEWKPSNPTVTPAFFLVLGFLVLLLVWKRPRMHPVRWALVGVLLLAALLQMRHQAVFAIVAAMILPEGFAKSVSLPRFQNRTVPLIAAIGAALLVAVRAVLPMTPPDNEANPRKLIAAVPPELRPQPVLNAYSMGGPLILSGIRPYIDGRGDMYGDELVVDYADIVHGNSNAFNEAVKRWNIRWAILSNHSTKLIAVIDQTPGWRRIAQNEVGVIYVRSGPSV